MREDYLKELGLSPRWVRKGVAAVAPPSPPPVATQTMAQPVTPPAKTPAAPTPAPAATIIAAPAPAPAATGNGQVHKMDWQHLQQAVQTCQLCGLCKARKNPAFGAGDRRSKVMFIGEGPGEEEDRRGEPFVGRAGKLLDLMLHAIALNRKDSAYITNIVKCRPPGNRNPTAEEAQTCLPYLQRQIALAQPDLIVALGKVAATYLLGVETSIAQLRQKMHDYNDTPLIVTYHPAYLLRNPPEKRKSWDDLKFIRDHLTDPAGG